MKKLNLKMTAVALALSVSSSVFASEDPSHAAPNLTLDEKALFSLNETAMGILAGIADATSCAAAAGRYSYYAEVYSDGEGFAILDDRQIDAEIVQHNLRGTVVKVTTSGTDEVGDVDIKALKGTYNFSRLGEIMYNRNDFEIQPNTLGSHWEEYDNHMIKDYYWGSVYGKRGEYGVLDAGLVVVTKQDDPRTKWRETSQYKRPNGQDGKSTLTLVQIAPDNAPTCKIQMRYADVTDFGSGLQLFGKIKVSTFLHDNGV